MDSYGCKKPRVLESGLRTNLIEPRVVDEIKSAWRSSTGDFVSKDINIIRHPFPVCLVRNFVKDPELLKLVAGELENVQLYQKNNDLYQFKQSDDLKNLTNFTFIPQLYDFIRLEVRPWVDDVIGGNKLNHNVSATFSSYQYQDRLLCHDDKCEDRHIAFILYLMEDWDEDDGGSLDLFTVDSNYYPSEIVESIQPVFNMMVFFEVTQTSFHQVAEVKSKTKQRLSVNGWFHSTNVEMTRPPCPILENHQVLANSFEYNLGEYFSTLYFGSKNKKDIRNLFIEQSEIQLDEFLVPKFLKDVSADLRGESVTWIKKGPANIRNYEVADVSSLPKALLKIKDIFESSCWFKYLREITNLDLAVPPKANLQYWLTGIQPVCYFEIQRWTHSCYTLIHDKDPDYHSEALDVILRIPFQEDESDETDEEDSPNSGHIIYIDALSKDEECLLHIGYKMNSLGLIYRDTKTLRFTKYLDSTAKPFYLIFCTYRQWRPSEDSSSVDSDSSSY